MKRNPGRNPLRSSVLVIVLVTLLFTAMALTAFVEKASNDLLMEVRDADARRLRGEAYSALEVTLAVLEDFRQADSGLHSTAEGWGDPLGWAGWEPSQGRTVEVSFQDESGKLSLSHVDLPTLTNLFEAWQVAPSDAARLADMLLGWMQQGYVYTTPGTPSYERSAIPYDEPGRPLRSFTELAAIDGVKDFFFDERGQPNAYYWRFVNDCSLFNFPQPDVNGANADVLAAAGQFTEAQQQQIADYMAGKGSYAQQGQQWFQNSSTVATVAGAGGNAGNLGSTITALRILITVRQGQSQFRLSAVVSPQGGATLNQTVATNATSGATGSSASATTSITNQAQPSTSAAAPTSASTAPPNLNYPFAILEMLENDQIPPSPPPPAASS